FPYTTLFRSRARGPVDGRRGVGDALPRWMAGIGPGARRPDRGGRPEVPRGCRRGVRGRAHSVVRDFLLALYSAVVCPRAGHERSAGEVRGHMRCWTGHGGGAARGGL